MKYVYKISYGGTSSISSSPQIFFNAVDELNDLFEIIIKQKSNYKDYTESQFIKEFEKDFEDLEYIKNKEEILDNIYNYDKNGEIYKEDKYKIVTDDQLNYLIPKIKDLYLNTFGQMPGNYGNYVLKEYFSEKSKVIYLGDYHSSIHSLIIVIKYLQSINILNDNYELSDNYYIVFLGDIVDRGPYGIECLYIIYLLYSVKSKTSIFVSKYFMNNFSSIPII